MAECWAASTSTALLLPIYEAKHRRTANNSTSAARRIEVGYLGLAIDGQRSVKVNVVAAEIRASDTATGYPVERHQFPLKEHRRSAGDPREYTKDAELAKATTGTVLVIDLQNLQFGSDYVGDGNWRSISTSLPADAISARLVYDVAQIEYSELNRPEAKSTNGFFIEADPRE